MSVDDFVVQPDTLRIKVRQKIDVSYDPAEGQTDGSRAPDSGYEPKPVSKG
jgi:hypothetical protein